MDVTVHIAVTFNGNLIRPKRFCWLLGRLGGLKTATRLVMWTSGVFEMLGFLTFFNMPNAFNKQSKRQLSEVADGIFWVLLRSGHHFAEQMKRPRIAARP